MDNGIIVIVIGLIIGAMGVMNFKGNISTLHSYHRKRVASEDGPAMGKAVGIGSIIIGVAFIVAGILTLLKIAFAEIFAIAGCVVGLPIILISIIKYNKGLF